MDRVLHLLPVFDLAAEDCKHCRPGGSRNRTKPAALEYPSRVQDRKGLQMRRTNINAVLKMTKDYPDGKMSRIDYALDVPYEVEKRYKKMSKEDADYTDMLYYYLTKVVSTEPPDCLMKRFTI